MRPANSSVILKACTNGETFALRATAGWNSATHDSIGGYQVANRSLTVTRLRLELGDINYLLVLNAQQTYLQALDRPCPVTGQSFFR